MIMLVLFEKKNHMGMIIPHSDKSLLLFIEHNWYSYRDLNHIPPCSLLTYKDKYSFALIFHNEMKFLYMPSGYREPFKKH